MLDESRITGRVLFRRPEPSYGSGSSELRKHICGLKTLSGRINYDKPQKSGRGNRRLVWWRRGAQPIGWPISSPLSPSQSKGQCLPHDT